MQLKIGQLARMAGCQVGTIRYYEQQGLLPKPERTSSNYRLYGLKDMERLRFILHCRAHGMQLAEIRELLAFKDNPRADCTWINTLVAKHIHSVTQQMESLQQLKEQLEKLYTQCAGGKNERCGILDSLAGVDDCPYCQAFSCGQDGKESAT